MSSKTKKLITVVFAFAAALCLVFALFLSAQPRTALADGESDVLALTDDDLLFDGEGSNVITGFTEEAKSEIDACTSYTLTINSGTSIQASSAYSDGAFYNQRKLTSLVINAPGEFVVGAYAFYGCTSLESVVLSNTVNVEKYAFYGANALKSLDLGDSITTIGESSFAVEQNRTTLLKELTIPASVTSIGNLAFAERSYLETINFYATKCADFTDISGSNISATTITNTAKANPFLHVGNGVAGGTTINIGDNNSAAVEKIPAGFVIASNSVYNKITSVNFKNITEDASIGAFAFCYCTSLSSVTFTGDNGGSIEMCAFYNCTALKSINIPSTVSDIGNYSFYNCTSLESISVPSGVTVLGDSIFRGCTSLKTVFLQDGLTGIGSSATDTVNTFYGCTALTTIDIPASVTYIGQNAFYNCTNLKTVNYDAGSVLETIGDRAFYGCTGLTVITIPAAVKQIGNSAYSGCSAVSVIYYYAKNLSSAFTASSGTHPFSNVGSKSTELTVYIGSTNNEVNTIPENMFYCSESVSINVTSVILSNVTANISNNAFRNCVNLNRVIIENSSITEIGNYAFYKCQTLSEFELPDTVKSIGDCAFQSCKSLLTITLPETLEEEDSIGNNAFDGCERLFSVINKSGLELTVGSTAYGKVAYYAIAVVTGDNDEKVFITSADGLHFVKKAEANSEKYYLVGAISTLNGDIVLPDSVPQLNTKTGYDIYSSAFQNFSKITSVTIPSSVGVIGQYAFYQCTSLKTVNIEQDGNNGVREIGQYAFEGCTSLTQINLPEGLDKIDSSVFQNCSSLKSITIPASVTEIGSDAFHSAGLTSIEIPENVTTINSSAFSGCSSLSSVSFLTKEITGTGSAGETTKINTYSLVIIGYSAFQDCTSLKSIVIPDTVIRIDGEAFSGATNLTTVYLPASATYGSNIFSGCNANLILISASKQAYNSDKAALGLSRMTYIINVTLDYGEKEIVKKLFGFDYNYELQADGSWSDTGSAMPVQKGYSQSIWYPNTDYNNDEVLSAADINAMLRGEDEIVLYAHYFAKPDLTVNSINTVNYEYFYTNYNGVTGLEVSAKNIDDINDILFSAEVLVPEYTFSLFNYKPFVGTSASVPQYVREAGTYTIEVNLDSQYGVWDEPYYITFNVDRWVINISNTEVLNWVLNTSTGVSHLNSETLWIPDDGYGRPYVATQASAIPEGYTEKLIEQSVTRYSGSDWELIIEDSTGEKFTITYNRNSDIKEREVGIYTAEAIITPTNNYRLNTGSGGADYGIICTPANTTDGSYTVQKKWYIVAISNTLWAGEGSNDKYDITGWTYNEVNIDSKIPAAPTLAYGAGQEENLITFTLSYNDTEIFTDEFPAPYSAYSQWINKSMPAGNYVLKINVSSTQTGGDAVATMTEVFNFTVANAKLDSGAAQTLVEDINKALNGQKFTYLFDGSVKVASEEVVEILANVGQLNPNRSNSAYNAWASPMYDDYFGSFSISYNISTMPYDDYFDVFDLSSSQYAPREAGEYTVFYQLTAPNYEPLVASASNKRDYSYTLIIYQLLNADELIGNTFTYTGTVIIPVSSNDKYQVISLEENEKITDSAIAELSLTPFDRNYTDVGTPKIVVKILNPTIYRWANSESNGVELFGDNNEYALISFEIVRCENSTTRALDIIRWSWGSYDASVNLPIWSTKFGIAEDYTFTLVSVANSRTYSQDKFGEAPAGEYTLRATAAGGDNYNWEEYTTTATINILKADNYWDVVPTVYDWLYGEYNSRVSGPDAVPHFGTTSAVTSSFYKINADGAIDSQRYTSLEQLLVDGEVPVGEYLMRVEVAGSDNYNAMPVTDIRFRVSKAYNSWIDVPFVVGWSEGNYNKVENKLNVGASKFGEVVIEITDKDGNVIDADNLSSLKIGNYTLTAYVNGTENYYEMSPITTTFAVVEESIDTTGVIAATIVFAVIAVCLAAAVIVFLIMRSRKMEAEFRKMVKKELGRK